MRAVVLIVTLSEKIGEVITKMENVAVPDVVVDAPVLATYEGALYRGIITEVNGDECQVLPKKEREGGKEMETETERKGGRER